MNANRIYTPVKTIVEVTYTQVTKNGQEIPPQERKDYTFELVTTSPVHYPKNEAAYNKFYPLKNASLARGDKWLKIVTTSEITSICER